MKSVSRSLSRENKPDRPYIYSEQVGFLLRKAYQRNMAIFQKMCPEKQLTSVQFAIVCALRTHGPQSLSEVGRLTAIDPSTTKGIIDRLHDRGVIELSATSRDKRKVIVRLTPAGDNLFERINPAGHKVTEATLKPLNPAERVALLFLLNKVSDD